MFGHTILPISDIDWDEILKGLEEGLPVCDGKEEADVKPQLPNYFHDIRRFAKVIYEFWTNTLHSDGIDTPVPPWDDMTDEEKDHFAESVQVNITEPLSKYLEALQRWNESQAKSQAPAPTVKPRVIVPPYNGPPPVLTPTATYPCYGCSKYKVDKPGGLCRSCNPTR